MSNRSERERILAQSRRQQSQGDGNHNNPPAFHLDDFLESRRRRRNNNSNDSHDNNTTMFQVMLRRMVLDHALSEYQELLSKSEDDPRSVPVGLWPHVFASIEGKSILFELLKETCGILIHSQNR